MGRSLRIRVSTVVLSVLLARPVEFVIAQCAASPLPVALFGKAERRTERLSFTHPQVTLPKPGSAYIRVRLRVEGHHSCSWMVIIRDERLRPTQTLGPEDFVASHFRWTNLVEGSELTVEMRSCSSEPMMTLALDRLVSMPATAEGSPETSDARDRKELYDKSGLLDKEPSRLIAGDVVGLLMVSSDNPLAAWTCSGFMLTDTLFLTNWHCGAPSENPRTAPEKDFWTEDVIQNAIVDLSWDTGHLSREFQVTKVEQTSKLLDFALLRVTPLGKQSPVPAGTLANWVPSTGDHVFVIHHPLAMKKQYSAACRVGIGMPHLFENWVDSKQSTDFTHDCTTDAGSSGAPVFSKDGEIIGLHHLGYDFDPDSCEIRSENKAVSISELLRAVKPELLKGVVIHTKGRGP
jgi:hypothetical protein